MFVEKFRQAMSEANPGCIFGLLQMILGRWNYYEGAEIYLGSENES